MVLLMPFCSSRFMGNPMSSWFLRDPGFLVLLPILAIPWLVFTKNRMVVPFPGCYYLQNTPAKASRMGGLGNIFLSACLFFLVLALAQPAKISKHSPVKIEGLAVEFVLDISGSMAENLSLDQATSISRLNLAKENIHHFLQGKNPKFDSKSFDRNYEGRAGDFIGLVAFASRAQMLVPLTLDHSAFLSVLNRVEPKIIPGSSETNISDALALAIDKLMALPEQRKLILLLTDGEHNVAAPFSGLNPIDLATLAAKLNIAIYTLNVGYPAGDKIFESTASSEEKEKRRLAHEGLKSLAQITNGLALDASDEKSMTEAFQKIDSLEQQPRMALYSKPSQDFYPLFLFASLICCGVGIFSADSRWQRIA